MSEEVKKQVEKVCDDLLSEFAVKYKQIVVRFEDSNVYR